MDRNNILVRYDQDLRLRIVYPEARKEITRDVVRVIRRTPGPNVVSFTFANEANLHRVIHNELDYFRPLGQPFTWKVYDHDLLPSLKEQLASHGFAGDAEPRAVMVLDVRKDAGLPAPAIEVDTRLIDNAEELRNVVHVLDQGSDDRGSWVKDRLARYLQIPGSLSILAAYVADQPASIAWTHFPRGQFARLSEGFTLAEYRRQGRYTSLLGRRLNEIRGRGYHYAVFELRSADKALASQHGFQHLTTLHNYRWDGN